MVGPMASTTTVPTPPSTTAAQSGPPPSPPPGARLLALDGLRFGAAAAVLLYHFTATSTVAGYWGASGAREFPLLNPVSRYGWLGVELFFVLSGFVILLSAHGRTVAQFTGSRVGRLFPAYWACIGATALLQALWSGGRAPTLAQTLVNLTMVQDLFDVRSVQVVFWTLLVELKFYLLVGLLLAFGELTRVKVVALALAWPLAGLAVQEAGWREAANLLAANYAPYFGVGMMLFLLRRDGLRDRLAWGGLLVTLALCAYRVLDAADAASRLQGVPVSRSVSLAVMLACVAAVWVSSSPAIVVRRPWLVATLATGGALTYPLYLVHSQFGYAVIDRLTADGVGPRVTLAVAVAACVLLAVAIHRGVERPTSTRLRRAVTQALTPGTARVRVPARALAERAG